MPWDTVLLDSEAGGNALGAEVDGAWQAFAHLRLRAGVRADLFSATPQPRIGPRFSATWLMSPHSALTLAAGRYHQYVRATEAAVASSEANDAPAVSVSPGLETTPQLAPSFPDTLAQT